MKLEDVKFYEWEVFVTKCLVMCGLEPIMNTHLESFIYADVKMEDGWEVGIYVDGPGEWPNSKVPFGIRLRHSKFIPCEPYKPHPNSKYNTIGRYDTKELAFANLSQLRHWVDENRSNIISGLLDYTDMK